MFPATKGAQLSMSWLRYSTCVCSSFWRATFWLRSVLWYVSSCDKRSYFSLERKKYGSLILTFHRCLKATEYLTGDSMINGVAISLISKLGRAILTFEGREDTPLSFLPSCTDQPSDYFLNQESQIFWIRLHDFIKFSKFSRSKEYFCQSKFEIIVIQTQSFEQCLEIQ